MGYHYNLAQLISLQVVDGDSVLFLSIFSLRIFFAGLLKDLAFGTGEVHKTAETDIFLPMV